MALTFKVSGLIELINALIKAHKVEEARYTRACDDARADYIVSWNDEHVDDVRRLRDYLTKCLKDGVPPRHAQVKRLAPGLIYSSDYIRFFTGGGDGGITKKSIGYQRVDELEGLAALLTAHTDDTVTAHQLKELGTHPKDLEKLFRAAALAGVVTRS